MALLSLIDTGELARHSPAFQKPELLKNWRRAVQTTPQGVGVGLLGIPANQGFSPRGSSLFHLVPFAACVSRESPVRGRVGTAGTLTPG